MINNRVTGRGWSPSIVSSALAVAVLALPACSFFGGLQSPSANRDSAPNVTLNPQRIADAEPRVEPKSRGGNRRVYSVFGQSYRVLDSASGFVERGEASWYGKKFHGRDTANGERYDMFAMTAAHKHLPLPTYVSVTNLDNGKSTIVRVNDRGPFHGGRIIDLSYAAATKLGMLQQGTARVEVRSIDPQQWLAAKERSSQRRAQRKPVREPALLAAAGSDAKAMAANVAPLPSPAEQSFDAAANAQSSAQRHYLQVAAYQDLGAAQGMQNQLLEKINAGDLPALASNVVIHPTASSALYRVRIGPVASRQQVEQLKAHPLLDSFGNMYPVVD